MPLISHRRIRKRFGIAVIAGVVVLGAILLIASYRLWFGQFQTHSRPQNFNQIQATADALVTSNHAQAAADTWANYAQDEANPQAHRAKAWQNAGLQYMTVADYPKALDCFQKSAAITGVTYPLATEIAQAAARAGNKAVAIQYFKLALKLIPKDMPAVESQKQLFNNDISQLEQPTP